MKTRALRWVLRSIGGFTLLSILSYAFADMSFWMPLKSSYDARGAVLYLVHAAGIFCLVASFLIEEDSK